jgi:hypothetical protein
MKQPLQQSDVNPAVDSEVQPVEPSPEEVVQVLRSLRERILLPPAVPRGRRMNRVEREFVDNALSALGVAAGVQTALGRTDEQLREEVDIASRWINVTGELRSLLKSVLAANKVRRQQIDLAAIQTYQICQQLARDGKNERLEAYISEMKRSRKLRRSRRPATQPEPGAPVTPKPAV